MKKGDYWQEKFRKVIRKVIKRHPNAMNAELAGPLEMAMADSGVSRSEEFAWRNEVFRQLQRRVKRRSKIKTKLVVNNDGSRVRIVIDERQGKLPL